MRPNDESITHSEIDLIIDRPGRPRALIEIKSSTAIRAENIKTLRNFKKEQSSVEAFCLSRDPNEKLIDKVRVIPWQNGIQKIFWMGPSLPVYCSLYNSYTMLSQSSRL